METIWKDRARVMGLPILFTRYWINKDMLHRRKGFFWINDDRLPLYRVLDVRVKRSPLDRILGLGTVVLYAADVTDVVFFLKGVRNPNELADLILERANELRTSYGIHGREMYGAFMGEFSQQS